MVSKTKKILVCLAIVLAVAFIIFFSYNSSKESFLVKTFLVKINFPVGSGNEYKVNVQNIDNSPKELSLKLENLDGISYLENEKLFLDSLGENSFVIYFNDTQNVVKTYSGSLIISDGLTEKKIPIVVTTEDSKSIFSIIPSGIPKYLNVYPGGKFGVDIKVYDLNNANDLSVNANYQIQNFNGEVLWSDEGDLIIEGSKTLILDIPKNWPKENYVFVTSINYKGTESISSYFFTISDDESSFIQDGTKLLIILALIFILILIVSLFYFIRSREDLLIQLKKQQNDELAKHIELIESTRRQIEKSKETRPVEKKKKIIALNNVKKKIISKIKQKQKNQVKEITHLKRLNKKDEIKNKLNSWRKEGYKLFETEGEIKKVNNPKRQMEIWKKQGYKAD